MELPNEIILLILRSLQKHDLKSARLVSKTWSSLAAEFLFDQVYVSAHPENLEVFSAIARHPLLSQCIKTLRYDAVDFEACTKEQYFYSLWWQTGRQFYECNREQLKASTFGPDISEWVEVVAAVYPDHDNTFATPFPQHGWEKFKDYDFISYGYQKYQKCAALQHAQFDNGNFLESLVGGLKTLKNLTCVMLDGQWIFPQEVLRDPKKLILKKPTGSPLGRDWNMFHLCPMPWDFAPDDNSDDPLVYSADNLVYSANNGVDHYWTIIAALLRSQRKIQTFKMADRYNCSFLPFVFDRTRKESLSFYGLDIVAFSELQVLKLSVARYSDEDIPALFPNLDGLRFLLRSVHQLRALTLDLPGHVEDRIICYKYSQVFPQNSQWKKMTSLSLNGISSSAADFLNLITRRMPALSHLRLGVIGLGIGDWEGVIECMKHSMHLSRFDTCPKAQFYHDGVTEFFDYGEHGLKPDQIKKYVESGGRHPCLRPDQPDSAAMLYITPDIQDFYKPIPKHNLLAA